MARAKLFSYYCEILIHLLQKEEVNFSLTVTLAILFAFHSLSYVPSYDSDELVIFYSIIRGTGKKINCLHNCIVLQLATLLSLC